MSREAPIRIASVRFSEDATVGRAVGGASDDHEVVSFTSSAHEEIESELPDVIGTDEVLVTPISERPFHVDSVDEDCIVVTDLRRDELRPLWRDQFEKLYDRLAATADGLSLIAARRRLTACHTNSRQIARELPQCLAYTTVRGRVDLVVRCLAVGGFMSRFGVGLVGDEPFDEWCAGGRRAAVLRPLRKPLVPQIRAPPTSPRTSCA